VSHYENTTVSVPAVKLTTVSDPSVVDEEVNPAPIVME
jgi:hypothetical protein